MPDRVYLETSIISYLAAHPSRDLITAARQQLTHEWWSRRRRFRCNRATRGSHRPCHLRRPRRSQQGLGAVGIDRRNAAVRRSIVGAPGQIGGGQYDGAAEVFKRAHVLVAKDDAKEQRDHGFEIGDRRRAG